MSEKYSLSGKIPLAGAGLLVCWGPLASIVLYAIYAVAQRYVPFIALCVLMTIFFPIGSGVTLGWFARRGHVRNSGFTALVALVSAIVGYYVMWGVHFLATLNAVPADGVWNAFRPDVLWHYVQWGYDNGFWTIGRNAQQNVSGIFLAVIWVVELGILVIAPPMIAFGYLGSSVYCETCGQWVPFEKLKRKFAADPEGRLKSVLQTGQWNSLDPIPAPDGIDPYFRLKIASCAGCGDLSVLTIEQVTTVVGKDGNEEKSAEIVENALLDPEDADHLSQIASETPEPPAPPAEVELAD